MAAVDDRESGTGGVLVGMTFESKSERGSVGASQPAS